MLQQEAPPKPGLAPKDAPRRSPKALANAIELADVSNRADAPPQPHAATKTAGAPGVRHQGVLLDAERILHFNGLDRQIRCVGDVHLHTVLAVAIVAPTHAAAEGLEVDVRCPAARVAAGEHNAGVGSIGGPDRL